MDKETVKRKRDSYDAKEKAMFWNIVKTYNSGKIWKTVTEGSSNTARHDAWVIVSQAFGNAISRCFTPDQAKHMFKRIKDQKKKDHDSQAVLREFNKSCSATGGGKGPSLPPQIYENLI